MKRNNVNNVYYGIFIFYSHLDWTIPYKNFELFR